MALAENAQTKPVSDHISYENADKNNPDALAVNVFTKPPNACTFCEYSKDNKDTLTEETDCLHCTFNLYIK